MLLVQSFIKQLINLFMKRIILSILTGAFISVTAFAQIPNPGFENWSTVNTYQNPDNWDNLNSMTSPMNTYTCLKGTPGNPGSSYLKLVSKSVSMMGVMPGVAVSGIISMATYQPSSGFACTQRPQSLTGNWQYMASGSDAGYVAAYLTKWNSAMNMRDTIAMINESLVGMQMSWTTFSIDFMYMSDATPDSAAITLSSSGPIPVAGSYLYVDNLAFAGSVAGIKSNTTIDNTVAIYPNPTNDYLIITSKLKDIQTIKVYNSLGEPVYVGNKTAAQVVQVNTNTWAKGLYNIIIESADKIEIKKLIVN